MITITFTNYHLVATSNDGITSYYSLNYEAYCHGDEVGVHYVGLPDENIFKGRVKYDQLRINGVIYGSAPLAVAAFNSHTAAALSYLFPSMKSNTDYPNTPFSARITANTATQIANYAYPGYVTIKAHGDNAGNVFVGPAGLTPASGQLAPGESVAYEAADLSTLWAINAAAGYVIDVFGAYRQ